MEESALEKGKVFLVGAGPGDPEPLDSANEVVEKSERWLIAPVKVIDRDHQWGARGQRGRDPVERVQHCERGILGSVPIRGV